jgi:hypothetical protein
MTVRVLGSTLSSISFVLIVFVLATRRSLLLVPWVLLMIALRTVLTLRIIIISWDFPTVLSRAILGLVVVALEVSPVPALLHISATWLLVIAGRLLVSVVIAVALAPIETLWWIDILVKVVMSVVRG